MAPPRKEWQEAMAQAKSCRDNGLEYNCWYEIEVCSKNGHLGMTSWIPIALDFDHWNYHAACREARALKSKCKRLPRSGHSGIIGVRVVQKKVLYGLDGTNQDPRDYTGKMYREF